MRKQLTVTAIVLCICFTSIVHAQKSEVTIENTQVLKFTSKIINSQEYVLDVQLPENYSSSNKKYPVVYILDGEWFFPLTTGICGGLSADGYLPDLILVGIKWGGENPDQSKLRLRDFKPDEEAYVESSPGNGRKFLSVIKEEIIPLIESTYKTDKDNRTLMGVSLGGFYTLYTFLKDNTLFKNYVSFCPALMWCNDYLFAIENELFNQRIQLKGKLYLTQGSLDGIVEDGTQKFEKLVSQVQLHNYENLKLSNEIVKDAGHSTVIPFGMPRALEKIFEKEELSFSSELLTEYTGTYQNQSSEIKITLRGKTLVASYNNGLERTLVPESDTAFSTKGVPWMYVFKMDAQNNCIGLNFRNRDRSIFYSKRP